MVIAADDAAMSDLLDRMRNLTASIAKKYDFWRSTAFSGTSPSSRS
jgi:hypothetical protein